MNDQVLFGFGPSVYTRVIRLILAGKRLAYHYHEVNPFDADAAQPPHPFNRVPVLRHNGFEIYETTAIGHYLDTAFPDRTLTPSDAKSAARVTQVIQIVDAYGYWPMVRQVFGHCVFRPHEGHMAEPAEIAAGLAASAAVLQALEEIAQEGHVLSGSSLTRAECHLAPMIAAFTSAPQGASLLRAHPALWHWWCGFAARPAMRDTDTGFDQLPT